MSSKYESKLDTNLSPFLLVLPFTSRSNIRQKIATFFPDMAGIMKRMRGEKADSVDAIAESPQIPSAGSTEPVDLTEKDAGSSTALDSDEEAANRRLRAFERAHRWDPNLDDDQLDEIDAAVNAHDPRTEGKLIGEVFENSPYPEVCWDVLQN
jgi:hypothetical protein